MIWLKENQNLVGYVPVLKKEYTEEEIREMSEYSCYQGWSTLSMLVMQIQGIGYKSYEGYRLCYGCETIKRLVDISFTFDFECFLLPDDERMKTYRRQIFEVFENLTLYKVKEHSKKEVKQNISRAKRTLKQWVSNETLSRIDFDKQKSIRQAEEVSERLATLQKMFVVHDYRLTHDLFANADEEIQKKIYEERKEGKVMEMRSW